MGNSRVSFLVKTGEKSEWFYLSEAKIDHNLIEFKNNIKIGMNRNEFYKELNINPKDCDTLEFQLGDLTTYYDFIFKNNKLSRIEIKASE
jgi:hypothetical protein